MSESTQSQRIPNSLRKAANRRSDISATDFGKVPPQARDLEEAVLGAILLERDALDTVVEVLRPEAFYLETHQLIFQAILQLFGDNQPVDILTVTEQLKSNGQLESVGGPFAIANLTNRVASSANAEYHARIVAQKYIQRQLITESSHIIQEAYEDTMDVFELLDKAEQRIFTIADSFIHKDTVPMSNILNEAVKEIQQRRETKNELSGVPSGFFALDRITNGWQPSDLIIVAARPGMGKTAFTLALARNAAIDAEKPVAIFSLEMSSVQLVSRLISMETEIPAEKLRTGQLEDYEWQHLRSKSDSLRDAKIYVDDTPALSVFDLRAKCRRLKSKYDIQMVVIDYLQLMRGDAGDGKSAGNREQEISMISRSLKVIAKELSIPVIALSQLSRAVEQRGGNKRPILSDLRESGAIEQDADMVVFLYRPEYYGILQDDDGNDCTGVGEVIIAKHRNGALDTVRTRFIPQFAKFTNLERLPGNFNMEQDDQGHSYMRASSKVNEDMPFGNEPSDDTPF